MAEQPQTLAQRLKARYRGVYDDIPDAELEQRVRAKYPGAYDDLPMTATSQAAPVEATAQPSALQEAGRQLALGARGLATGAMTYPAMGADVIGKIMNLGIEQYNKLTNSNIPQFPEQMQALESNLTAAGVPEPQTASERVIYDANRGGGAAASTAVPAAALAPGIALAAKPILQIVQGVISSAASGITRELGGGPGAQLAAGLAAGAVPNVIAGSAPVTKLRNAIAGQTDDPNAAALLASSQKHDVPLSYGDVSGGATVPKMETALEQVPGIGMGGYREAQHAKAMTAAENVRAKLDPGVGENWAAVGQQSLARKAERTKQVASSLYDDVGRLADAAGAVPTGKTIDAIDKVLTKQTGAIAPDAALVKTLETFKGNLESAYRVGNFTKMREFRSALGGMISDYYTGKNALVGEKGVAALQSIRSALDEDMADFAQKKGGDLWTAWRKADDFYKGNVVPLREKSLAQIANTADPDDLYRRFLGTASQKPETLYKALGPAGQASVRYGLVNEAYQTALNAEGTKFSPAKFAKYLEDRQRAAGVFFKGQDSAEITGFMNLMRHAQRAGQYAENPPTGNRWLVSLMTLGTGAGLMIEPGATGSAVASVALIRALFTTEAGKRLLLASSRAKPGTDFLDGAMRFYAPLLGAEAEQLENRESGKRPDTPSPAQSPSGTGRSRAGATK